MKAWIVRVMGNIEAWILAAMALICALGLGFIWLLDEVLEGDTGSFDKSLLLALRNPADPADPVGPGWLEELARDFTALGGTGFIVFILVASAIYLWLKGHRWSMLVLVASVGSAQIASSLLKHFIARPRPELVPHGSIVYTASFPSGHSLMSAITFLTLAALLAEHEPRRAIRIFMIAVAIFLSLGVGVSRVYLGVHWPTDVLAGWCVGAAWALGCWLIATVLERRYDKA